MDMRGRMRTGAKRIELALDRSDITEADRQRVLRIYQIVCYEWADALAQLGAFSETARKLVPPEICEQIESPRANMEAILAKMSRVWPEEWDIMAWELDDVDERDAAKAAEALFREEMEG